MFLLCPSPSLIILELGIDIEDWVSEKIESLSSLVYGGNISYLDAVEKGNVVKMKEGKMKADKSNVLQKTEMP